MKDGWPSLSAAQALQALELWTNRYGGGELKLTGGEPLLEPDVVRAVLAAVTDLPTVQRVLLCTNGLALTTQWLRALGEHPKVVLLLSLDGRPDDHRLHRRPVAASVDVYDHVVSLLPLLLVMPRVIVTQTIAPDTAARAGENFEHLLSLGFSRFKFLPVYYQPWTAEQVESLRRALGAIAERIKADWAAKKHLYVRNLFTWAPTPLFNTSLVVDSDGSIHASNAGLASACAGLLDETRIGSLAQPPSFDALEAKAASVRDAIQQSLPAPIWQSTLTVDEELTRFCRSLYPDFLAYRKQRRDVA